MRDDIKDDDFLNEHGTVAEVLPGWKRPEGCDDASRAHRPHRAFRRACTTCLQLIFEHKTCGVPTQSLLEALLHADDEDKEESTTMIGVPQASRDATRSAQPQ